MKVELLIKELKKSPSRPTYWLEGDEDFFIDEVINFAETKLLTEAEAGFNLTVFYGRDADWATVTNACRRYPMFAERQVIIVKEAQAMREIERLETYIDKPLTSTILFIAYKGKKVDGRTKFAKTLKDKAVLITTKKLWEKELPDWTQKQAKSKGLLLGNKALHLLIDHLGNDLSRINNELDKIMLNLNGRAEITEDDIEKYVGISKEYNVFELQDAFAKKDSFKALRIAQYFQHNPKAGPLQFIFPSLYGFFSKVQMIYDHTAGSEKALAASLGVTEWKLKDYIQASVKYQRSAVEENIILLHHYNLRSLGIKDAGTDDGELLKEMIVKMMNH